MNKPNNTDPFDVLATAYEKMYEQVAENLHKVTDKTGPLLHELVDDIKDKAVELEEVAEEDANKFSVWLKRDFDHVIYNISETDHEFKDWLGFESTLIKDEIIEMFLNVADKTTVELERINHNNKQPDIYHAGEIAGLGTLVCDECGEKLYFHQPEKITECPQCTNTCFHRIKID